MDNPLISVIMPSYNTKPLYLREAVQSVLIQTYTNFELLIIDDGSIPSVESEIADISDSRIRVICNSGNRGLPYSINKGIDQAEGKYLFRMDSDDRCIKTRLQRQVTFFERNPSVDIVSSFARCFGTKNNLYRSSILDKKIKAELLWKNPIIHPTVAIRANTIKAKNIRYNLDAVSEDFELWSRMAFLYNCNFAVIPEELLAYRVHSGQITITKQKQLQENEKLILKKSFNRLNLNLSEHELDMYQKIRVGASLSHDEILEIILIMRKILNNIPQNISKPHLRQMFRKAIIKYCMRNKIYRELICLKKLY